MKLHEIMKTFFSLTVPLLFIVMPLFGSSSLHEKPELVVALKDAVPLCVATSSSFDVTNVAGKAIQMLSKSISDNIVNLVDKAVQMVPKGVSDNIVNMVDKSVQMLRQGNSKVTIILLVSTGLAVIILLSTLIAKIRRWMFLRRLDKENYF